MVPPTERVVEASQDNRLIQAHWDIVKDHRPEAAGGAAV